MRKVFLALATILMTQSLFAQVHFGRVRVGSMNRQIVWYRNNTPNELRYSHAFTSGFYFNTFHNCYGVIRPYQSCSIEVQYWPGNVGYHSAYITMNFYSAYGPGMYTSGFNAWGEAVP